MSCDAEDQEAAISARFHDVHSDHTTVIADADFDDNCSASQRQLSLASRYNVSDPDAPVVTVKGASVGRFTVIYRVAIIVGERAREWEIRQASALKGVLLWHYQRRRTARADRERPAA